METGLQKRRHYNQHSWRKPAIYTFLPGRKKERERRESFYKKQRLEKEERKEFSITITLFRPRLFLFSFLLFSLLSEDHKAAKILDSRFSSETSDGSPSVGRDGDGDGRARGRTSAGQLVSAPSLPLVSGDELLISLPVITRKPPGRRREGLPDFGND